MEGSCHNLYVHLYTIYPEDLESNDLEPIWIELTPKHHPPYLICVTYRSQYHNLNDWYESFSDQVTNAYIECEQVTIMSVNKLLLWVTSTLIY